LPLEEGKDIPATQTDESADGRVSAKGIYPNRKSNSSFTVRDVLSGKTVNGE